MITHVNGKLEEVGEDWVVIDVNGLGYMIAVSNNTRSRLPSVGSTLKLFTEVVVRNEHQYLCGFIDQEEKHWFKLLLGVQGVGVKVAMAILSALSIPSLLQAVYQKDHKLLTVADGVGAKVANRIVLELQTNKAVKDYIPNNNANLDFNQDVLSALLGLGYSRSAAINAINLAQQEIQQNSELQDLLRLALQKISQG